MRLLILLCVALLVGGGWYAYQAQVAATERMTQEATNEGESWTLTASFMCADGRTRFEASFIAADQLELLRDGVAFRTLSRVDGPGQRFEDDEYLYVFAGEEVTVTTKASGTSIVCSQPFDANNAPVNFGDRGEGGGERQDVVLIVSESIVGRWDSANDAQFSRQFNNGYEVVDIYGGEVVSRGTFAVFTRERPLSTSFPLEEGVVYVQLRMTGVQGETLNFKLNKLTPEELELTYMERGGVLRFTRANLPN